MADADTDTEVGDAHFEARVHKTEDLYYSTALLVTAFEPPRITGHALNIA